jgi:hypothetical protein
MKNKIKLSIIIGSLTLANCGSSQNPDPSEILKNKNSEKILCEGANNSTTDGFGGGNGTQENPYLICTVDQFKLIQGDMNKKRFFKLTSDLDFRAEENLRIIAIAPFASIDGGNHKIKNIKITHGNGYKDNGLFGQLVKDLNGNRDEIKNLIIENVQITGDGTDDGGGVIASVNLGGIISNVHVTGNVQIQFPDSGPSTWSVGGLVGRNASLIEGCTFEGNVLGVYNVGGIAGLNEGTIRNSRSYGIVSGRKGSGGIVGVQLKSGVMENNRSLATAFASQYSGELVGLLCNSDDYSRCGITK